MTPKHSLVIRLACAVLIATCLPAFLQAQQLSPTLDAIFNKHEFDVKHFGPARWIDKGAQYTTVEPSATVSGAKTSSSMRLQPASARSWSRLPS